MMEVIKFNNVDDVLSGNKTFTFRVMKPQPYRSQMHTMLTEPGDLVVNKNGFEHIVAPKYKPGEVYEFHETAWRNFGDIIGMQQVHEFKGYLKILSATPMQVKEITEEMAIKAGHCAGENGTLAYSSYAVELMFIYGRLSSETWGWGYSFILLTESGII